MKESIGMTQLFIIVVTLILLFSGIMALAINRANSFTIKDKLVNIIEKHGGFDMQSELSSFDYNDCNGSKQDEPLMEIACALQETSYRQKGVCPEPDGGGDYKVVGYQRNGSLTSGNGPSSFCIYRYDGKNDNGTINVYYYKVVVFYHLDLPVIKNLLSFRAIGETKALYK